MLLGTTAAAYAQTSWDCGSPTPTDVTATLSGGTLTISGTGAMADYTSSNPSPWYSSSHASITTVVIEQGVTTIGDNAFEYCRALTSVTIPNSVTSIGTYAFEECNGLTSITIPASGSVTSIGLGAFYNCNKLTSATIPGSVTSIAMGAFARCTGLTSVYNYRATPQTITSDAFSNMSIGNVDLYVLSASLNAYQSADVWQNFKQKLAFTPAVTGVSLISTLSLLVDSTETLSATVSPADAFYPAVTWSSSDDAVATVSSAGLVTALSAGSATITATTADGGFTATCSVTVSVAVTGVSLNENTLAFMVGGTETLTAAIAPANATTQSVTWSSNDDAVATVNAGVVTAVAPGTATITVTTDDGDFTATCAVTIVRALSNDVATLQALVIRLLTDSIALRTTISDLQAQLSIANTTIAAVRDSVNGLQTQLSTAQSNNSGLQAQLSTANTTITTVRDSVSELQSSNSGLQAQLSTANTTITAVRDTVSELQSSNSGLQTQLSTANSTITTVRDSVNGLQTQLSTAQSANSNLQAQLSTANSTIATVRDSVSGLQTQLSVANTDIATLTQELNTCKAGGGTTAVAAPVTALLKVYPNPVQNGELIIDDSQLEADGKVEIYNVNGGLVETRHAASPQGGTITINIGHLPAGIYIVKLGNKAAKIVKQ
jgi:uncharacterized protein YjdB